MSPATHPAASHHLPGFITAPGDTDVLMAISLVFLLVIVIGIGVFYFRLHALPEQIAHKGEKVQFQIVAVLALIALFTHNHIYWIAALLLALVPLPDFSTPLREMAKSLTRMADVRDPQAPAPQVKEESQSPAKRAADRSSKPAQADKAPGDKAPADKARESTDV
jgi:hypothetical protein